MTRWPRGEREIEQLIQIKALQRVLGAQADGTHLLEKAARTLATATAIRDRDADSAFLLAYDATRYCGTALLAHQGLRPTMTGGHYAVEVALRAPFGEGFKAFGTLRRRRNELEYPSVPVEVTTPAEVEAAIADARRFLGAANMLLPKLSIF